MIYLIATSDGAACKIGFANDAIARMRALQVGNHVVLRLLHSREGGVRLEQIIHKKCADHRLRGEWFSLNEAVIEAFNSAETLPPHVPAPKQARRRSNLIEPLASIRERAYAVRVPISKVMSDAGIASSTFYRWEKEDGPKPHPVTLGKIEDALGAIEAERPLPTHIGEGS